MKIVRLITILTLFLIILSCVPGSDGDFIQPKDIHFPLAVGNRCIYNIVRAPEVYTDSSEVLGEQAYNIDDMTVKWLFQFKDISLTLEELYSDTARVRLLAYDSESLKYYGEEKRDRSQSHFIYGVPLIFSTPVVLSDNYSLTEEFFIDSLTVKTAAGERVLRDTTVACVKVTEIGEEPYPGSNIPDYRLDIYFTDFGIVKYEGYVNGVWFRAKLKESLIK